MELKSQDKSSGYLSKILLSNRVPPAILFFGPKGSGKGYLARQFAADYLCQGKGRFKDSRASVTLNQENIKTNSRGSIKACGVCSSCQQIKKQIHPDFIIFSGKDLHGRMQLLHNLAAEVQVEPYKQKATELLHDLEGKKKREQFDDGKVSEAIYQFKDLLKDATTPDDVATVITEMAGIAEYTKPGILPVRGIRKIIEILSKRPMLGDERVILVEDIDLLRKEGTNAFLKTLEEPPESTVIILTTSKISSVLPTIRSRCALLPFQKLSQEDIITVSTLGYGVHNPKKVAKADSLYGYLQGMGGKGGDIHKQVVRFIELIDEAEYNDDFFDFLEKDIAKAGEVEPFLVYLSSLLGDVILSRDLRINKDKVINLMFSNYSIDFLKSILKEVDSGLSGLKRYNLNEIGLLRSIFMGFYEERIS